MPKDRDQLTPDDPEDADHLAANRGQGTGGSGHDRLTDAPSEALDDDTVPEAPQ